MFRQNGTKVAGIYHGVTFTGTIRHNDIVGNGRGANGFAVHVDVDEPIEVYGTERTSIRVEFIPACWDKSVPETGWETGGDGNGNRTIWTVQ